MPCSLWGPSIILTALRQLDTNGLAAPGDGGLQVGWLVLSKKSNGTSHSQTVSNTSCIGCQSHAKWV